MTRWRVGWIAGSEHEAHGEMDSLFAQPYIIPSENETVDFPSQKEILLVQQSAVNVYDRCQQSNATARSEGSPQKVDASGMRIMSNGFPSVQLS
jgi:hypothetical protein